MKDVSIISTFVCSKLWTFNSWAKFLIPISNSVESPSNIEFYSNNSSSRSKYFSCLFFFRFCFSLMSTVNRIQSDSCLILIAHPHPIYFRISRISLALSLLLLVPLSAYFCCYCFCCCGCCFVHFLFAL